MQINSPEAETIINLLLIIINEVYMMFKYALDAIDMVLRRICRINAIFRGKTVLFGGDFRQVSAAVAKGF